MDILKLLRSFGYGFTGLANVLRTEQNMRLHFVAVLAVCAAGAFFRIDAWEWIAVVVCFGLVLALECVNTALERLCDEVTAERRPLIKQAKDAAAASVLSVVLMSVVVGGIVFVPRVWLWLFPPL